jgi:sulfide:quinone oxidoreductase
VKKILILGAGFGGLETATGLAAVMKDGFEITLIDKNDAFFIGFSKIDVLFGHRTEEEVSFRYANLRPKGVRFVKDIITAIDTDTKTVTTEQASFTYDYLVVALGAALVPGAIPGFVESGGHEFYSMAGVKRLKPVLDGFNEGTLVLGIFKTPYKCPPAPYEVAYQMHERFVERGVRDAITMKMVIPAARPVGNPKVSDMLERLLGERNIALIPSTPITSIDADGKQAIAGDTTIDFDLFVGVPVHTPPAVVKASKLAPKGFIMPRRENLETDITNVYAVGDVTKIPVGEKAVPKAGAFAEDAAKTVVSDILRKEGLVDELVAFKGKGACYFEFGGGQVAKVDANYFAGDKPKVVLEGPAVDLHPDKVNFLESRRDRWFTRSE